MRVCVCVCECVRVCNVKQLWKWLEIDPAMPAKSLVGRFLQHFSSFSVWNSMLEEVEWQGAGKEENGGREVGGGVLVRKRSKIWRTWPRNQLALSHLGNA